MGYVYLATNRINGKRYVGQSIDFDKRKNEHRKSSLSGSRYVFHCAIRKYGFDAFDWEVLKHREFITREQNKLWMTYWEKHYIKELNTMAPNGYNLTKGGEGVVGYYPTDEYRNKKRKEALIRWQKPGARKTQSESVKKALASPIIKAKQWLANKEAQNKPTALLNHSRATKRWWAIPENREKKKKSVKEWWAVPENRERMIKARKEGKRKQKPIGSGRRKGTGMGNQNAKGKHKNPMSEEGRANIKAAMSRPEVVAKLRKPRTRRICYG